MQGNGGAILTRTDIESGRGVERAEVLAWVEDPIELFFPQVQGSGRIELPSGELLRVATPTRTAIHTNPLANG